MNDELIYALIGLGLHWWVGWRTAKAMARRSKFSDVAEELAVLLFMFMFGSFMFVIVHGFWFFEDYCERHGNILNDRKEDEEDIGL